MSPTSPLDGVMVRALDPHSDDRGEFTEIYRAEWAIGAGVVQWNAVRSEPGVLRGVHVHSRHTDYLVLISGRMRLGLHDCRPQSSTCGGSLMVDLDGRAPAAVVIPPGVAHGFYYYEPSVHIYAVSQYWSDADEHGCRFDAHELGFDWPSAAPRLSARDSKGGGFDAMMASFLAGFERIPRKSNRD